MDTLFPKDSVTLLEERFSNCGMNENGTHEGCVSISVSVSTTELPLFLTAVAMPEKQARLGSLVLALQTSQLAI